MYFLDRSKLPKGRRKLMLISLLGIVLVVGLAVFWYIRRDTTTDPAPTASTSTKGEVASTPPPGAPVPAEGNQPTPAPTPQATDKGSSATTPAPAPSTKLLPPSGTFVSNHEPNLSGSPTPNQLQSTCSTTPGVTCQIFFTKDGVTKSLPAQKTDSGGATYWTWKLQTIGLTEGSWKVTAKSTNGDQTVTSDDAVPLEVRQ
jgi:hypothetical protein